jgi:hypothetical protein
MKEKKSRDPAFGERLTNLMKEKGIKNNNRFALAINKAPIVTLGWLNGKIPAYPDDWKLLCEFFNVSADFLLLGKEREKEDRTCNITVRIPIPGHDKSVLDLNRLMESQVTSEEEMLWYLLLLILKNKFAGREEPLRQQIPPEITETYIQPTKK